MIALWTIVLLMTFSSPTRGRRRRRVTPEILKQMDADIRSLTLADVASGRSLNFIPDTVRLSFHDCVGGCDGCVNFKNVENRGLPQIIQSLEPLVQKYSLYASRADMWALAGTSNALLGAERKGTTSPDYHIPKFGVWFGRKDCRSTPDYPFTREFPQPTGGIAKTMDFFDRVFNFDALEVTALLGAHTLGGAIPPNSQFHGFWTNLANVAILDNEYYQAMISTSPGWRQEVNSQWNRIDLVDLVKCQNRRVFLPQFNFGFPRMFLNADMSLYRNITPDDTFAEPTTGGFQNPSLGPLGGFKCHFNLTECPLQAPVQSGLVELYASDNQRWLDDFAAIYGKMLRNGAGRRLYQVTDDLYTLLNS